VERMSADEINCAVKKAFEYDEYRYQQENGILITEPYRAEGLHKILYQCPHCMTESKMDSKGAELFCTACGKRWTLQEDGSLAANDGETEFTRVPDWYLWEREQVEKQIEDGTYSFEDEVEVYGFPRCWRFIPLGNGKLRHDPVEGFTVEGEYNGAPYRVHRTPAEMNSLHVEYDYCYIKPLDCLDISTEKDSVYCYPTKQNVITKLAFATEILHLRALRGKK
jgi:DNA-directed RNA polymerase subunit RPC12/RpoP